jgi:aerobic C4-dicarboxylate transport protein
VTRRCPHPQPPVSFDLGIARALGNLIGNCVATVAVAAWEGDIDRERAHAVLDGKPVPPTEDDADVIVTGVPVPARA